MKNLYPRCKNFQQTLKYLSFVNEKMQWILFAVVRPPKSPNVSKVSVIVKKSGIPKINN